MSAWETFRRSLRRREPSTPWLSPEDTYGSAGRVIEMSRAQTLAEEAADRIDQLAADLAAVRGQRDEAADALYDMTEGIRAALLSAGYFHPSDDLVADVRHMASEYVRSVAELRSAKDRASDLAAEVAGLTLALDAARLRPSDTSDQDRRNCVDMSDQLAAVRREKDDLEGGRLP